MTPVYNRGSLAGVVEDSLRELIAEGEAERSSLDGRTELADLGRLMQTFLPADQKMLEQLFRAHFHAGDLATNFGSFIHLPLVRDTTPTMYPVLTFAYDWPRQILRLRVALFYRSLADEPHRPLRAFGLRFETPECRAGTEDGEGTSEDTDASEEGEVGGHHDMFHAQPVRRLHHGMPRTELPGLRWMNPTQPSIPVSAEDTSGLLLATLVSIYGRRRVVERQKSRKLQALSAAASQVSGFVKPPLLADV